MTIGSILVVLWLIVGLPILVFATGFLASVALERGMNRLAKGQADESSDESSAERVVEESANR